MSVLVRASNQMLLDETERPVIQSDQESLDHASTQVGPQLHPSAAQIDSRCALRSAQSREKEGRELDSFA